MGIEDFPAVHLELDITPMRIVDHLPEVTSQGVQQHLERGGGGITGSMANHSGFLAWRRMGVFACNSLPEEMKLPKGG